MQWKVNRWTGACHREEIEERVPELARHERDRQEPARGGPQSSGRPTRRSHTVRWRQTHRLSDTLSPCSMTFVPIARDNTTLPLRAATRARRGVPPT